MPACVSERDEGFFEKSFSFLRCPSTSHQWQCGFLHTPTVLQLLLYFSHYCSEDLVAFVASFCWNEIQCHCWCFYTLVMLALIISFGPEFFHFFKCATLNLKPVWSYNLKEIKCQSWQVLLSEIDIFKRLLQFYIHVFFPTLLLQNAKARSAKKALKICGGKYTNARGQFVSLTLICWCNDLTCQVSLANLKGKTINSFLNKNIMIFGEYEN